MIFIAELEEFADVDAEDENEFISGVLPDDSLEVQSLINQGR